MSNFPRLVLEIRPVINYQAEGRPDLTALPFIREEKKRRNFWAVEPTGDYAVDFVTGQRYALELLAWLGNVPTVPSLLTSISEDMAKVEKSGIEAGFWWHLNEWLAETAQSAVTASAGEAGHV